MLASALLPLLALQTRIPTNWYPLISQGYAAWESKVGYGKLMDLNTGAGGFHLDGWSWFFRGRRGLTRVNGVFLGNEPSKLEWIFANGGPQSWPQAKKFLNLPNGKMLRKTLGNGVAEQVVALSDGRIAVLRRGRGVNTITVVTPTEIRLKPSLEDRKGILDGLRAHLKGIAQESYEFKVSTLNESESWAFVLAEPTRANGSEIDWTRLVPNQEAYDKVVAALLQRKGRGWAVREIAVGPTDVAWTPWPKKHDLPFGLFNFPKAPEAGAEGQ